MAQARNVVIALLDISGYTRFLVSHRKAQTHANMIVGSLLEALIDKVGSCLEIAEIEGDAIFMYAFTDGPEGGPLERGNCLLTLFRGFSTAVQQIAATSICKCPACENIDALRLKLVMHSGQAVLSKLGRFTKLSGVDVITAHRLLKNSVQADEYILLTESAKKDVVFPDELMFEASQETYGEIGTIDTHVAVNLETLGCTPAEALSHKTSQVGFEILRHEIREEYAEVATEPDKGFHFHTGRPLAQRLGYEDEDIDRVPDCSLESFAGTGNPFIAGALAEGEKVVDIGCGAGFDTLIASHQVGATGKVIGVDMTEEMLERSRRGVEQAGASNVDIVEGYAEALPVEDEWADVIISNGVFNLCPNKPAVLREMFRVLKPGGRLQLGDILIQKAIPESAKLDIDLWTG